jgi:paraquat-inducible protein A
MGIIESLYSDGQTFFAVCILLLAVVMPMVKLFLVFLVAFMPRTGQARHARLLHRIEWLAEWSMLDVLLLSLAIFLGKKHGAFDERVVLGVTCFVGSVIASLLAQHTTELPHVVHPPLTKARRGMYTMLTVVCTFMGVGLLVLGITEPIVRFAVRYVSVFGLLDQEYSVVSLTAALYAQGSMFLCIVLFVFSILFPIAKLCFILCAVSYQRYLGTHGRVVRVIEWLGRYSMTDIMVLALMVFYMNGSGYTESNVFAGTYYFSASVFITMLGFTTVRPLVRSARLHS